MSFKAVATRLESGADRAPAATVSVSVYLTNDGAVRDGNAVVRAVGPSTAAVASITESRGGLEWRLETGNSRPPVPVDLSAFASHKAVTLYGHYEAQAPNEICEEAAGRVVMA